MVRSEHQAYTTAVWHRVSRLRINEQKREGCDQCSTVRKQGVNDQSELAGSLALVDNEQAENQSSTHVSLHCWNTQMVKT